MSAEREFHGLAEPLLHRPGRNRAVADEEGAERAVVEFNQRNGGILDREAALAVRGDRLDGHDFTDREAEEIDLVDQVDQDRTAAGLAPPRRDLKIAFRFVRGPDRRDPDDVADPPLTEQRLQRPDLQMMATVMTDQRFDAAFAYLSQQRRRALQRIGDRFLDQDIDAPPGAFDAGLGVKLVR